MQSPQCFQARAGAGKNMEILYGIIPLAVVIAVVVFLLNGKKVKAAQKEKTRQLAFYPIEFDPEAVKYHYVTTGGIKVHSTIFLTPEAQAIKFPVLDEAGRAHIASTRSEAADKGWTECGRLEDFDVTLVEPQAYHPDSKTPELVTKSGIFTAGTVFGAGDAAINDPAQRLTVVLPFNVTFLEYLFESCANEMEHYSLWKNTGKIREFFEATGKYFWYYLGANDSHPIFASRTRWTGAPKGFAASKPAPLAHNCMEHLAK